ncbi:Signal transduction histidine-protein kinase ArlS [Solibacillus isronensis B3W22]|uniref:histidine kinase n=1 Tax=Solibacillus isronensis B3W22 TaxID=1224748 RepID=K1L845_9BACL|nr:HAMP domain-containing sensor histidine kinase [Solibacillus isronensis]AMO85994.1 two-component sensor histidine kinase [Solibacillus silvestris]EKB46668.1 Signal transduction histidine-protein kinase ArlS [Solibacillus isronensis B3W22]
MKLNTKVNLFSMLLTSVILIGSFTGIYYLYKEFAFSTEAEQLQARANELTTAISALESMDGIDSIFGAYLPTDGAIIVREIDDNTGKPLIRLQKTSEQIDFKLDPAQHYTEKTIHDVPHIALATPIILPNDEIAEAKLIQPLPTITDNMNRLLIILVLMTLVALIPIYLASQLFVQLIVKPVLQLTSTMEKNIQQSSYEQIPTRKQSNDEIAQMATTYNHLMAQLEDAHDKQQQFVGNASHELKTPLTVIESYTKLLKRRGTQDAKITEEALEAILKETTNMKAMIEQMLALAKTNEMTKINMTTFALQPFIDQIVQSIKTAYHREIHVNIPDVDITTDEAKLKQLLFIFIDNARKYSDDVIKIHASVKNDLHISIQDFGVGIPQEDLPNLFHRFYRVDKDRNRKTGGTGIGLSIAKELADRLNAEVSIDSELGKGTTILLIVPLSGGAQHES